MPKKAESEKVLTTAVTGSKESLDKKDENGDTANKIEEKDENEESDKEIIPDDQEIEFVEVQHDEDFAKKRF